MGHDVRLAQLLTLLPHYRQLLYFALAFAVVVKVIAVSLWITASSLPVAAATPVPAPASTEKAYNAATHVFP